MTDKNRVEIVCVVDRSGSMELIRDDAQGGLNSFISGQKAQDRDVRLTLVQFDTEYEVLCENIPICEFRPYTLVPRGGTALLDAIGNTINRVGARLRDAPERSRPSRVIFMIVTDGQENSSREFAAARVSEMISRQSRIYSWEFLYIAANQDAICEAESFGIPRAGAMNFTASPEGVRQAYEVLSKNMSEAIECGCVMTLPDDAGTGGKNRRKPRPSGKRK